MKALICEGYGPIANLVVKDVPSPVPGPKQVLIEVKAASVNFPDALMVQGLYQVKPPLPFTPGSEVAGIVKAVGAEDDDALEAVPTKTEVKVETQPAATEPSEPPVTLQSFCASLTICRDMAAVARVAKTMGERLPEADKEAGREAVKAKKAELRAADSDGAMGNRQ